MKDNEILSAVQKRYATAAQSELSNEADGVREVARAFGYSVDELASLPPQANMGLSCGNPTALANLRNGETVVDLGCGGGIDVLLAASKVGPGGKALGIDMTAEMLHRARLNATKAGAKKNVEFHQAEIDNLPLPDDSVDCIISNCVINLAPDKAAVFREMMRVLKPGGRVAISDIALLQPLPAEVRGSMEAYVGCIAGAILISQYEALLHRAGFDAVVIRNTGADLNAYALAGSDGCCSSETTPCCGSGSEADHEGILHDELADVLRKFDANIYAASVSVHAVKGVTNSGLGTKH